MLTPHVTETSPALVSVEHDPFADDLAHLAVRSYRIERERRRRRLDTVRRTLREQLVRNAPEVRRTERS